ncbi:hypothetical protein Bca4012_045264 [Brassica carinata]|uniref:Uncharacterized protein n=1 Tax=Brassica carinata TaxID=52824 RepID=A0A8X7QQW8_BRACI|nr:hypothetical protein Bca52824_057318 [Brassica carinata]
MKMSDQAGALSRLSPVHIAASHQSPEEEPVSWEAIVDVPSGVTKSFQVCYENQPARILLLKRLRFPSNLVGCFFRAQLVSLRKCK